MYGVISSISNWVYFIARFVNRILRVIDFFINFQYAHKWKASFLTEVSC